MALFLGVVLSATLFAGINVGADTSAKQALDQSLSNIMVDAYTSTSTLTSQDLSSMSVLLTSVSGVKKTEVIARASTNLKTENSSMMSFTVTATESESKVYSGLTVVSGASSLGANETFVVLGSRSQDKLSIGDSAVVRFQVYQSGKSSMLNMTLKVVGFVQLTDQALSLALSTPYSYVSTSSFSQSSYDLVLVDWAKTLAPISDFIINSKLQNRPITPEMEIYLDRASLVDPWDIPSSQQRVAALMSQLSNKISTFRVYISNNLQYSLSQYQYVASSIMFTSLITALPVFFIAWYMTTTVSSVIFNLRRREIGLLLTKGLSKGQLLRTFLGEALTIGLLGGVAGAGLSLFLTPLFVGVFGGSFGVPVISWGSLILTVSFSVGVTLLAIFQPARKAAGLKAIDALREYLFVQEERGYSKRLSWIAFILGTYKMAALAVGFSVPSYPPAGFSGNIILSILYGVSFILDNALNYIGSLLFFWGFTKIFIVGSLKLQSLTSRATRKLLGDFSIMAARNVERSPARVAAIAFLVALIVGHSVSVVGSLASQQDYNVRSIKSSVGSDLSVTLSSTANASQKMLQVAGISKVSATTIEYSFNVYQMGAISGNFRLTAVQPKEWLSVAYYEDDWFSGNNVADIFQAMASDNDTIVLDKAVGQYLSLKTGDYVSFSFSNGTLYRLKVVGFFGTASAGTLGPGVISLSSSRLWSYVPYGFFSKVSSAANLQVKILAKLEDIRYGESVSNEIQAFSPKIGSVSSVYVLLSSLQTNAVLASTMNVQRIGVAFAIVAASIETVLVVSVGLNERKREVCMMSVRGLSFRQIASTLFAEDLVVVVFAVLLGLVSGLVILRGSLALASAPSVSSNPLLIRHIVFPLDSTLVLGASLALIFASVILPVFYVLSRYLNQLERVVRQA